MDEGISRRPRSPFARPSRDDTALAALLGAVDNLNDNLGQLRHGIKTLRAVRLQGAQPVTLNPSSGPQRLTVSAGRLVGWSVYSPTTAGVMLLRDGSDPSGDIVAVVDTNNTGKTDRQWPAAEISFSFGLFLDFPGAGDLQGVIYLARVDKP